MILLTSYERMRRYLSAVSDEALTDSANNKHMIMNWILTVSKQIEEHLQRNLTLTSYTEYFDVNDVKNLVFYVKSYPITTLTDVYMEPEGLWDGTNESEIEDVFINKDSNGFVIPYTLSVKGYKVLRARFTGGLALYGVKSVFTISNSTGTWTSGQFIKGSNSEAVGIIKSLSGTSLTVEILYGIFETDDILTEYTNEGCTSVGDASATLSSIINQSLVEQYPDIVRAAEIQTRFYWKYKDSFELASTQKDATNVRSFSNEKSPLTKQAIDLLEPYVNRNYL